MTKGNPKRFQWRRTPGLPSSASFSNGGRFPCLKISEFDPTDDVKKFDAPSVSISFFS